MPAPPELCGPRSSIRPSSPASRRSRSDHPNHRSPRSRRIRRRPPARARGARPGTTLCPGAASPARTAAPPVPPVPPGEQMALQPDGGARLGLAGSRRKSRPGRGRSAARRRTRAGAAMSSPRRRRCRWRSRRRSCWWRRRPPRRAPRARLSSAAPRASGRRRRRRSSGTSPRPSPTGWCRRPGSSRWPGGRRRRASVEGQWRGRGDAAVHGDRQHLVACLQLQQEYLLGVLRVDGNDQDLPRAQTPAEIVDGEAGTAVGRPGQPGMLVGLRDREIDGPRIRARNLDADEALSRGAVVEPRAERRAAVARLEERVSNCRTPARGRAGRRSGRRICLKGGRPPPCHRRCSSRTRGRRSRRPCRWRPQTVGSRVAAPTDRSGRTGLCPARMTRTRSRRRCPI